MYSRSAESRWFWIPGIFAALLFVCLILRWLPVAIVRADNPYGVGQVVAGDLALAWKSFLRCAVAYVVTAIALDYLPPIRWRCAFAIAATALVTELVAEITTGALFGAHAGTWLQLTATGIAYSFSVLATQKWALAGSDAA
jgi:hypothetical protein